MKVYLNDEPISTDTQRLLSLLEHVNLHNSNGIAVAVNSAIVPRNEWDLQPLQENDRITIIRASQGG